MNTETAILAALAPLALPLVKVDEDGEKVTISARFGYLDINDPSVGYDDDGKALNDAIGAALAPFGLSFHDGGFEDDGSGEYHIYRA